MTARILKYGDFVFNPNGTYQIEATGLTGADLKNFTEPFERALAPLRRVDYAVAGLLKVPTSRARMCRPIGPRNAPPRAVLVAMPDPGGHRRQRAFEILLEAGRARVPEMDSRE